MSEAEEKAKAEEEAKRRAKDEPGLIGRLINGKPVQNQNPARLTPSVGVRG